MLRITAVATLALGLTGAAFAQDVTEPKTGTAFPAKTQEMSLLGIGLRTKTFLKVKVYAVGFYVADAALTGTLASHKGDLKSPAFYQALVDGDFPKEIVLKFVRNVSSDQIQGAFREDLAGSDPGRLSSFVAAFGDTKEGQEDRLHWSSASSLETFIAGQPRGTIADKAFASAVLGIWLGPKAIQDDIKAGLVARAGLLIK